MSLDLRGSTGFDHDGSSGGGGPAPGKVPRTARLGSAARSPSPEPAGPGAPESSGASASASGASAAADPFGLHLVQCDGKVGQAGDPYERHADAVADRVVRGESAVDLLDAMPSAAPAIQKFESPEHVTLGDDGARAADGTVGRVELAAGYTITNGEMVALAGDFFQNIDQMRRLAAQPGPGANTREEIEYARVCKITEDESRAGEFSEPAKAAVERRYYSLAANNASHFAAAETGDAERSVADRAGDAPHAETEPLVLARLRVPPTPANAIEGYRYNHARALAEAASDAHTVTTSVEHAQATEGFGAHYLTDAFSAGHVRTPRQSIKDYWDPRVPMFFTNLKGWMAEEIARRVAASTPALPGTRLRTDIAMTGIPGVATGARETVTARLDAIGPLGFGDLVSGALHDYDNAHGVRATSGGAEVVLHGDRHLGEGAGDEQRLATEAVRLGRAEVQRAYELGQGGADPQSAVDSLLGDDGLYAAERMIPQVVPDERQDAGRESITWQVPSYADLLGDPRFAEAAGMFASNQGDVMRGVVGDLDESQRNAVEAGVIRPLTSDPIGTLRTVINWSPTVTDSAAGHNTDDDSMDYLAQARATAGGMASLTPAQRERLIRHILDGATVGDEETAILEVLTTASDAEARRLITTFGWQTLYDELDDGPGEDFAERFPQAGYGR